MHCGLSHTLLYLLICFYEYQSSANIYQVDGVKAEDRVQDAIGNSPILEGLKVNEFRDGKTDNKVSVKELSKSKSGGVSVIIAEKGGGGVSIALFVCLFVCLDFASWTPSHIDLIFLFVSMNIDPLQIFIRLMASKWWSKLHFWEK